VLTEQSTTFDMAANGSYGRKPKISLHQSGRAHAKAKGTPLYLGACSPLWDTEGGHIATILTFDLDSLPPFTSEPQGQPHVDALLNIDPNWTSVRVALYAFSDVSRAKRYSTYLTLVRPGLPGPLHVALGLHGDRHGPDNRDPGVVALAGWGHGELSSQSTTPVIYAGTV
jgi:hypothetical protein